MFLSGEEGIWHDFMSPWHTTPWWNSGLQMLGELHFLDSLKEYDKDNIAAPIMKKIRDKYLKHPDFVPEVIRNVSSACEGLCKWVRAMEVYDQVAKVWGEL